LFKPGWIFCYDMQLDSPFKTLPHVSSEHLAEAKTEADPVLKGSSDQDSTEYTEAESSTRELPPSLPRKAYAASESSYSSTDSSEVDWDGWEGPECEEPASPEHEEQLPSPEHEEQPPSLLQQYHEETGMAIKDLMRLFEQGLLTEIPRNEEGKLSSLGSRSHATGTCSPCVFWSRNQCWKGLSCPHCHFQHPQRRKSKPHRQARELIRQVRAAAQGGDARMLSQERKLPKSEAQLRGGGINGLRGSSHGATQSATSHAASFGQMGTDGLWSQREENGNHRFEAAQSAGIRDDARQWCLDNGTSGQRHVYEWPPIDTSHLTQVGWLVFTQTVPIHEPAQSGSFEQCGTSSMQPWLQAYP